MQYATPTSVGLEQGLLLWLFEWGFKVSSVAGSQAESSCKKFRYCVMIQGSSGTQFDNSEIASPVEQATLIASPQLSLRTVDLRALGVCPEDPFFRTAAM